jgi:RNA polymerase sigma-70 factor (ECF subfamily)
LTESKLAREQVEALYQRHAAAVRRFLLGVLRDGELAEEAMQQTFVQLIERGQVTDVDNLKGWIFKVAFHQAMALRRRQRTDARAVREVAVDPTAQGLFGPAVIDQVLANEDAARTRAALEDLPAAQREVLRLRFAESKTFAQIAAQLGVPLGTALTRMRLALNKLRTALKP